MGARKRTSASGATATKSRPRQEAAAPQVPSPSRAELASAFAQALDLGEGRDPGHAARVCYIALNLAKELQLPREVQSAAFYASLLHDAGATTASAEICRVANLNEEALFRTAPEKSAQQLAIEVAPANATAVVELLRAHTEEGAFVAEDLGFGLAVREGIAAHHERWDGHGYPKALKGDAIPVTGRIVGAADLIESFIAAEPSPLVARRNLIATLAEHAGEALDPELASCAHHLAGSDAFWLGLHSGSLPRELVAARPDRGSAADRSFERLDTFAETFAGLADAKSEHMGGHSARTAELADVIAETAGIDDAGRAMLHIACMAHDVGLLGIPARVISKPDILSLAEMEAMRLHPTYSQMVLEIVPGLERVARVIGAHHERPDGRGYPEMLEGEAIPLEARIIAVADTYVALTSVRPYRGALSDEDALQVLMGGAGTQLDRKLAQAFCALPPEIRSSQTAPRSRRTR